MTETNPVDIALGELEREVQSFVAERQGMKAENERLRAVNAELLTALEELVELYDSGRAVSLHELGAGVIRARAAIAKAKG